MKLCRRGFLNATRFEFIDFYLRILFFGGAQMVNPVAVTGTTRNRTAAILFSFQFSGTMRRSYHEKRL